MFQPAFDFFDDFGADRAHASHAVNDRRLPFGRQALDDPGGLLRLKVREDQGYCLRVLVDDEGQQILAIDLLQEFKRRGLARLRNRARRTRMPAPKGASTRCSATSRLLVDIAVFAPANSRIVASCSAPATEPSRAISPGTGFELWGFSLLISPAAWSSGRLLSKMAALRFGHGENGCLRNWEVFRGYWPKGWETWKITKKIRIGATDETRIPGSENPNRLAV